jgi:AcrR family transcriptional regulator
MTEKVKAQRRSYHSPLRTEQAENTRRRVVAAARKLFLADGYAATSIGAIATAAGVSPDTIYVAFGGKRGLIEAVIHSAMYRDEDADPDWATAIERLPSESDRVRAWVAHTCNHLADASPVHAIIRGAADTEPFAAKLRAQLLEERRSLQRRRARQFLEGGLPSGITVEEAADRYSALLSPELHHLLTVECGWPPKRYREWVTELLVADFFGVETSQRT